MQNSMIASKNALRNEAAKAPSIVGARYQGICHGRPPCALLSKNLDIYRPWAKNLDFRVHTEGAHGGRPPRAP